MKTVRRPPSSRTSHSGELSELRARLARAEETLRAIRRGEVDAVVVAGKHGPQVFTLEGAEHTYRVVIESMHEGALILATNMMVLYANQCFARMVKCPLQTVIGNSFRRYLSAQDRAVLRSLLKLPSKLGAKTQALLKAGNGSQIPVQLAIRPMAKNGFNRTTIALVVTDMTAAQRNEERLRALSHRVVHAQEAERGRVALELHDHITQLLCAVRVHSQALTNLLSARDGPARREAIKLGELVGETAEEVERISRNLRPGVLEHLGLVTALRDASAKFTERTGVPVKLACVKLTARLPGDVELAFFRILQEALTNVEKHSRARHVTVKLAKQGNFAQLTIKDDGIGFDPNHPPARLNGKFCVGLLSMRERAAYVGGNLKVKSVRGTGTEIEVLIPSPRGGTAAPPRLSW